jgi:hypothetical protein
MPHLAIHEVVAARSHRFALHHPLHLPVVGGAGDHFGIAHDHAVLHRVKRLDLRRRQGAHRVDPGGATDGGIALVEVAAARIPRAEPRIDLGGRAERILAAIDAAAVGVRAAREEVGPAADVARCAGARREVERRWRVLAETLARDLHHAATTLARQQERDARVAVDHHAVALRDPGQVDRTAVAPGVADHEAGFAVGERAPTALVAEVRDFIHADIETGHGITLGETRQGEQRRDEKLSVHARGLR